MVVKFDTEKFNRYFQEAEERLALPEKSISFDEAKFSKFLKESEDRLVAKEAFPKAIESFKEENPTFSKTLDLFTRTMPGVQALKTGVESRPVKSLSAGIAKELLSFPQHVGSQVQKFGENMEENPEFWDQYISKADIESIKDIPDLISVSMDKARAASLLDPGMNTFFAAKKLMSFVAKNTDIDKKIGAIGKKLVDENKKFLDAHKELLSPEEGAFNKFLFQLGSGATSMAGAMGMYALTKNPSAAAALFGVIQDSRIYQEARESGFDPKKSRNFALLAGTTEAALEGLGLQAFFKWIPGRFKTKVGSGIMRAATEAFQEFSQEVGEGVVATPLREYQSWTDIFNGAGTAALIGSILGGSASVVADSISEAGISTSFQANGMPKEQADKLAPILVNKIMESVSDNLEEGAKESKRIQDRIQEIDLEKQRLESELEIDTKTPFEEQLEKLPLEEELKEQEEERKIEKAEEKTKEEISIKPEEKVSPTELSKKEKLQVFHDTMDDIQGDIAQKQISPEDVGKKPGEIESLPTKEEISELALERSKIIANEATKSLFKKIKELGGIKEEKGFASIPNYLKLPKQLKNKDGMSLTNMSKALKKAGWEFKNAREFRDFILDLKRVQSHQKIDAKNASKIIKQINNAIESRTKETQGIFNAVEKISQEQKLSPTQVKRTVREKTGIKKPELPKKFTEAQALTEALRREERVSKLAEKDTQRRLKEIKNNLADLVKRSIPSENRGNFLKMIANAKSEIDVLKAKERIKRSSENLQKKMLIRLIQQQAKRIEKSKVISIDYVNAAKEIIRGINFEKTSLKLLLRAQRMSESIQRRLKNGEDVTITGRMADNLLRLAKIPANDMSVGELLKIHNDLKIIADIGKVKFKVRKQLNQLRLERDLLDIFVDSKAINNKELIDGKLRKLNLSEKGKNYFRKIINTATHKDMAIMPMDVIFDLLDGMKNYTGANHRIFKRAIDIAFDSYLDMKGAMVREVIEMVMDKKMDDVSFNRIGFHAAREQYQGKEKLEQLGYTEIEGIKLTEDELAVYELMRKKLDEMRPLVAEVMRVVYNEDLEKVKNYFPFITDFEAMSDSEIRERFGDKVKLLNIKKKNVEKGFVLARVEGGKQKIQLNALQIFMRHMDNASYLVTVGSEVKRLQEMAKTEEYRNSVGDIGQEFVTDWLDLIARKGRIAGEMHNAWDTIRRNIGASMLINLSSALIQPTALLDGAALIGGEYVSKGVSLVVSSKAFREFQLSNFTEVRDRIGDDVAFAEFGGNTKIAKGQRAGLWALTTLDGITAASVSAGAYVKYLDDNNLQLDLENPNKEGIIYAQKMLRRTQSSMFFKDAPLALSRGKLTGSKKVDKTILQFQSFMLNRWSLIRHDLWRAGIQSDNKMQAVNIATYLSLALLAEIGLRRLSKEIIGFLFELDVDDWDESFARELYINAAQTVPFVSQVVSSVAYSSVPVPALSMFVKLFELSNKVFSSKSIDTKKKNLYRALMMSAGIGFGFPSHQVDQILRKKMSASGKSFRI